MHEPPDPHAGRFTGDLDGAGWAPRARQRVLRPSDRESRRYRHHADAEICPDCQAPVRFDTDGNGHLVTLDPNWKPHVCPAAAGSPAPGP